MQMACWRGEIQDGEMYFVNEPAFLEEDGTVEWHCYGQNIAVEVLPEACQ